MKATGPASTPEVESGVKGEGTLRISPNALRVLKKRYLAKDENGKVIETPEGMFRRVAHNLAQADAFYGATPSYRELAELIQERIAGDPDSTDRIVVITRSRGYSHAPADSAKG